MRKKIAIGLTLFALTATILGQSRRTVWTGVYTAAQAGRGKAVYERMCIRCHAAGLEGVPDANLLGDFAPRFMLKDSDFMERWREDTAQNLFNLLYTGMPPRNEPGFTAQSETLTEAEALDVMTYLFQGNEFPAGDRELEIRDLPFVRIQHKDGPRPLPSFSTVQAVGCLSPLRPGVWQLVRGSEPIRVREFKRPTEEEMKTAAEEPLGEQEFDLQSIGYIGADFRPVDHQNRKMLVRGILIKQPPILRIDVRSLVEVAPSCNE